MKEMEVELQRKEGEMGGNGGKGKRGKRGYEREGVRLMGIKS